MTRRRPPGDDDLERAGDADAARISGEAPPSARVPLSRRRILAAATEFIEEHGLAELTMRRMGNSLGVEAMSLYRYVPGREDLLDGVVEVLVGQLDDDPEVIQKPRDGWQDFLQRLAHGIRRVALSHPKAFILVASRPPEAPWLRPPLRSLAWVEVFLGGMLAEGFDEGSAVAAYRAFSSFLLGHLLLEVSQLGGDIGPLDVDEPTDPPKSLQQYPLVASLRTDLAEDHSALEFEESLESLLDRLHLLRAS